MAANEQTRQNLLDAALHMFSEKGYQHTKVSDIVKKAGVAQGTFYLYFQNKESIFSSILQSATQSIIAQNERILGAGITPSASKEEILDSLYQAIRGSMAIQRQYRTMLYMVRKHGAQFAEAAKVIEDFDRQCEALIQRLLQRFAFFPDYGPMEYEVVTVAIAGVMKETSTKFLIFRESSEEELSKIAGVVTEMICSMTRGRV